MLIYIVLGTLAGMLLRGFQRTQVHVAPPAEPHAPTSPAPGQTPRDAPTTRVLAGSAGGLLLQAIKDDKHEPIQWVHLHVGPLVVQMARDAVAAKVGGQVIRLPMSYADTVEACKLLGCIVPTKEIVDAAYEQSSRDGRLVFHGLVRSEADTAKMTSLEFSQRFNAGIDKQLREKPHNGMVAGPWKYWILHPRIVEKGAVNYGGFDSSGKPIQTVGGRHDATHFDYSQLLQPVLRTATLNGRLIDLVDHFQQIGLPKKYVEAYK